VNKQSGNFCMQSLINTGEGVQSVHQHATLILTHGFRPTESQETASTDRPEKSIGAVQNTTWLAFPILLCSLSLSLSPRLFPFLPSPPAVPLLSLSLSPRFPCCKGERPTHRCIPSFPSATPESLYAKLTTWRPGRRSSRQNSPDAPAAAVFYLSAASSAAISWPVPGHLPPPQ
jgi:hypothetical protein